MAGRGPAPKPESLRQRRNKKVGSAMLEASNMGENVPELPNPDGRVWHPLTLKDWNQWWTSEVASRYLPIDVSGLGQLAVMTDEFYKQPDVSKMQEIRMQRKDFGLTPLDRSRLQWEVVRAEEAERKMPQQHPIRRTGTNDPRSILMAVK